MVIAIFFQNFGQLINLETGAIQNDRFDQMYTNDESITVYDNRLQCWRKVSTSQIPWTFTYARRPTNFREEARLWFRAAHCVKHRFVWAQIDIPRDDFAKLMSKQNIENYGRYTFANLQ